MLLILSFIITSLILRFLEVILDTDSLFFLYFKSRNEDFLFYLFVVGLILIVYVILKSITYWYQKNRSKRILDAIELIIDGKKAVKWSQFLSINYKYSQDKVKDLISKGIKSNLFYGELKANAYCQPYLDFISKKTLSEINTKIQRSLINNYKFVEKRNVVENTFDTYIYFSDKEKISLMPAPFNLLKSLDNKLYAIYDKSKDKEILTIYKSDIVDIFYKDFTYNKDVIAKLNFINKSKGADNIKVISLILKDKTTYELIGSDISLEI